MIYILFVFNIIISFSGFLFSYKNKSLIAIWWLYIFYYSILFFLNSFELSTHEIDWYSNTNPIISHGALKEEYYTYVTLTNLLMLVGLRFSKFASFKNKKTQIVNNQFIKLNRFYLVILLLSFIILISKISSYSYNDLTSSEDFGGWSWIFVQVSMSSVIYAYYKKNYKILFLVLFFSLVYTIITFVRSIFLYSIFTLFYLYLIDLYFSNKNYWYFLKKITIPLILIGLLTTLALFLRGATELKLPDSKMVEESYTAYNVLKNEPPLLFNDYIYFFKGLFSPFDRFLDLDFTGILTSPVQNSRILFTADTKEVDFGYFFHNPILFYNHFFASFGWFGIAGGFILIKYFLFLEKILRNSYETIFFFLPLFSWHIFMIFRGALDISTMGIAYALWFQLILYFIFKANKLL